MTLLEAAQNYTQQQKRLLKLKWAVGFNDRGLSHGDYCVMTFKNKELIVKCENYLIAQHIVDVHNKNINKNNKRER